MLRTRKTRTRFNMNEASTSQGRYFLLSAGPVASPAQCGICGYGGSERNYLDPRLDFEFYGTLIFCEECVGSMARLFGYLSPAVAKLLENRLENSETELIKLRGAVIAMEHFNDVITSLSGNTSNILLSDGAVASDGAEGKQTLPFDEDSESGGSEFGPDESSDESRRDDLRDVESIKPVPGGLSL